MKSSLLYKLIALIAVVSVLCFVPTAADASQPNEHGVVGYAVGGYNGDERGTFAPADAVGTTELEAHDEADRLILEMKNKFWGFKGCIDIYNRKNNGGIVQASANMMRPSSDMIGDFSTTKEYEEMRQVGGAMCWIDVSEYGVDVSSYFELRTGVSVVGGDGMYPVIVELVTDAGVYSSRTYVEVSGWSLITADISSAEGIIREVRIRVCFDETNIPRTVKVTEPMLTTEQTQGMKYRLNYMTDLFTAAVGSIAEKTGRIRPVRGDAYIEGTFISAEPPTVHSTAYFEIKLTGVSGGKMSVGLLYQGASEEQRVFSSEVSLDSPDGIYTIPVKIHDEIMSYSIQFDNVECGSSFSLNYVKVYSGQDVRIEGNSSIGTVQTIVRNNSKVTFTGIIERDAATEYSGQKIYFYAIPGNRACDLSFATEVGSTKISTRFEYTADLSKYPVEADTFMFFAAVLGDDGEMIPIVSPRYCDAGEMPETNVSSMGIYGGASVGVFESNMSHVIVDIPLDRIVNTSDGGAVISTVYAVYGDEGQTVNTITFSRDILSDIDRDVNFYISAGIKVYLRLTAAKQIDGLTYLSSEDAASRNIKNFAIDAESSSSRQMYAAIVRFLSQRYGGVDGFIVGMAVNNSEMNGGAESIGAVEYASSFADLCRVTYNAAAVYSPDVFVIVPFAESDRNTNTMLPDRSMAVMFADTISRIGDIPWTFMYSFDESEDNIAAPSSLDVLLDELDLNGAGDVMYFFEPTNSYVTQRYENYLVMIDTMKMEGVNVEADDYIKYTTDVFLEVYNTCLSYDPRAVFFAITELPLANSHEFYSYFKNVKKDDSFVYGDFAAVVENEDPIGEGGKYLLWDFSDKHYSLDWISVGGNSSCMTEYSVIFSKDGRKLRVLKAGFSYDAELTGISGGSGIALCNFKQSVDFTDISSLEFNFAIERDIDAAGTEHATVVFVVGNADYRAEYYTESVEFGKAYTMTCDLSGYAYRSAVDYVGIMVYSDADICLELSDVGARSSTLSPEDIGNIFIEYEEEAEYKPNYRILSVFVLITAAFSVFICVLLVRRDKEEGEMRKIAEESKNTRDDRIHGRRRYR